MLPQILVTRDQEKLSEYIKKLITQFSIPPHAVFHITPLKKELGIDQIRSLKKNLIVSHKETQLYILELFHTATLEAQNALLKTLEEKNENTLFLLITTSLGPVLPTIISRAQVKVFDQEMPVSTYSFMTEVSVKDSYEFLANADLQNIDAVKARAILEYILTYLKSTVRAHPPYVSLYKKVLSCLQVLNNNNATPQLLIDNLLIFIHKRITA